MGGPGQDVGQGQRDMGPRDRGQLQVTHTGPLSSQFCLAESVSTLPLTASPAPSWGLSPQLGHDEGAICHEQKD